MLLPRMGTLPNLISVARFFGDHLLNEKCRQFEDFQSGETIEFLDIASSSPRPVFICAAANQSPACSLAL